VSLWQRVGAVGLYLLCPTTTPQPDLWSHVIVPIRRMARGASTGGCPSGVQKNVPAREETINNNKDRGFTGFLNFLHRMATGGSFLKAN
jgi:hypothetical protein